MVRLIRVTEPADLPVTLARMKQHLRIDETITDEDEIIEAYLEAATDFAENFTGRAFIDQTWDMILDEWPVTGPIVIRRPPLIEVVGVFYADSAESEQEASGYTVLASGDPARIFMASAGAWPTAALIPGAVRIRFRAGYLNTGVSPPVANVPAAIKQAIMMHAAAFYEHREAVVRGDAPVPLPLGAEALLRKYRHHVAIA